MFRSNKVKVFGFCGVISCQVARPVTGFTGRTLAALGVRLGDPPRDPWCPVPLQQPHAPAVTQPWPWIRFSCRGRFGSSPHIKRTGESANEIERRWSLRADCRPATIGAMSSLSACRPLAPVMLWAHSLHADRRHWAGGAVRGDSNRVFAQTILIAQFWWRGIRVDVRHRRSRGERRIWAIVAVVDPLQNLLRPTATACDDLGLRRSPFAPTRWVSQSRSFPHDTRFDCGRKSALAR